MAAGLAYLHPSVVHRDLKPQVGAEEWQSGGAVCMPWQSRPSMGALRAQPPSSSLRLTVPSATLHIGSLSRIAWWTPWGARVTFWTALSAHAWFDLS